MNKHIDRAEAHAILDTLLDQIERSIVKGDSTGSVAVSGGELFAISLKYDERPNFAVTTATQTAKMAAFLKGILGQKSEYRDIEVSADVQRYKDAAKNRGKPSVN